MAARVKAGRRRAHRHGANREKQSLTSDTRVSSMDSGKNVLPKFENPFSEIQLLAQHTDIVRLLVRIDSRRVCSAGDDGLAVVWDTETGALLRELRGHSRPITCLCPVHPTNISRNILLLTASSDRLVCLWNVETGLLLQKFTDLSSTTKCIAPVSLDFGLFCFAGEKLCIWSLSDGILDVMPAATPEDYQFLLVMKDDILIAAADTHIVAFRYTPSDEKKLNLLKQLEPHRESVRSLVRLNDSCFASGSLDGTVLLWSVESLTITHEYNVIDDYQGSSRTYPFSIQCLLPLDERYLLCAQGCDLIIYDTRSQQEMLRQHNLHDGKILHLELICQGYLLATCSEDSSIKLWRCSMSTQTPTLAPSDRQLCKVTDCLNSYMESDKENKTLLLQLVGDCQAHSAAVQKCLDVPPDRFMSCAVDHTVILWKNGTVESCKRHKMVRDALFGLEDLSAED